MPPNKMELKIICKTLVEAKLELFNISFVNPHNLPNLLCNILQLTTMLCKIQHSGVLLFWFVHVYRLQDSLQCVTWVYKHTHCRLSCNLFISWPMTRCLSCTGSDWRQVTEVTALGWWAINHMQASSLGHQATCSVTTVSQCDSQTASGCVQ